MILAAARPQELLAAALGSTGSLLLLLPAVLFVAVRLRDRLERAAAVRRERPVAAVLTGAAAMLAVVLLAAAGQAVPAAGMVAVLLLIACVPFAFAGLVVEARALGRELRGREDVAGGPTDAGATALGWLVLAGLNLVPVVGWLTWLTLALRALGAALLGLSR